ncbi:MAG: hypothetical protein RBU21_19600 [FCB group bacterium]|jgi:hypothetical protein|nr:hypothetical protein [FCB group bacterium]
MGHVSDALRRWFRWDWIPWEWSDPWVRVTVALAAGVVGLLLADIWLDVPRVAHWLTFSIAFTAAFHRNALYLRRTGERPRDQAMFRELSVVYGLMAAILLIFCIAALLGL